MFKIVAVDADTLLFTGAELRPDALFQARLLAETHAVLVFTRTGQDMLLLANDLPPGEDVPFAEVASVGTDLDSLLSLFEVPQSVAPEETVFLTAPGSDVLQLRERQLRVVEVTSQADASGETVATIADAAHLTPW